MRPTKQGEYLRSVEVIQNIIAEQPLHMLLYFLGDSGYDRLDLIKLADLLKKELK